MSEKLLTVKFESEIQILSLKKLLSAMTGNGRIRPRGRHSDRKAVLGSKWRKWCQNDIPWRQAETVTFYLLDKN
jgi:hypothetical protein